MLKEALKANNSFFVKSLKAKWTGGEKNKQLKLQICKALEIL